jgi:hypothetical protein
MEKIKELIYKTIQHDNPRKREVSMQEVFDQAGSHITKKWTCKYFIRSSHRTNSSRELQAWLDINRISSCAKRNCHILKEMVTETGQTKVMCKMLGEFYVVKGLTAFKILYINTLKVTLDVVDREG